MKIVLLNHTWRKIKKLHQMKYDIVTKIDHEIETPAQSINSRPRRIDTGAVLKEYTLILSEKAMDPRESSISSWTEKISQPMRSNMTMTC